MYTLIPQGGIGNRMMTIASAIKLSEQDDCSLKVLWHKDNKLNCSYATLFRQIDKNHFTLTDIPKLPIKYHIYLNKKRKLLMFPLHVYASMHQKKHYQQVLPYLTHKNFNTLIRSGKNTLIQSSSKFLPYNHLSTIFRLTPEIQTLVDKNTLSFSNPTIGIHIRRTDHVISIKESPIELFINAMEEEISKDCSVKFYLATDSYSEKELLNKKFGSHIITRNSILERNSEKGIIEAVIDLYSLAKTKKIYGSSWSSFSEVASNLGNIELIQLKKQATFV